MIGVVVVSHGPMGQALIETAEMIVGSQENVHAIALNADDNLDVLRAKVVQAIGRADRGQGVLAMVDMFGGTPANAVASVLTSGCCECLCGVNLPMLLEAFLQRADMSLGELAAHVESMSCSSVVNLKVALRRAREENGPACEVPPLGSAALRGGLDS